MGPGEVDEVDFVAPKSAGVQKKIHMEPDDKHGEGQGQEPIRAAQ
jgi:hypothetical protein